MNQIKCLQPPKHAGVLTSSPPKYRCYREGCHNTWVVGTEAPECTMNQIPNIEETHNTREVEEVVDIAILNLIFSGLSFEQIGKLPDWLLKNIEKNKPEFKTSLHTSLVAAVEGKKRANSYCGYSFSKSTIDVKTAVECINGAEKMGYNKALKDTLTIINSIFKE